MIKLPQDSKEIQDYRIVAQVQNKLWVICTYKNNKFLKSFNLITSRNVSEMHFFVAQIGDFANKISIFKEEHCGKQWLFRKALTLQSHTQKPCIQEEAETLRIPQILGQPGLYT